MKLIVAALIALATIHPSHARREGDTVPEYSSEDCDGWIDDANSYDTDGSGGLDQSEFFAWIQGLGLVSSDASYQDMAWPLKVAFLGLACECQALGYGEDCCTGDNAQFPISDITGDSLTSAAAEIKGYMCDNLATTILSTLPPTPAPVVAAAETLSISIVGSVLDYSSIDYSGILDGSSKPAYYNAEEVNANEGDNNVITELTAGYQLLADELISSLRRNLRALKYARKLQTLNTVTAADVCK